MSAHRALAATYRLQLNHGFTLRDALAVVPYLHQLGVSHVYSSPLLMARPGSMHGYDVVDPMRLNPELGTEDDLRALVRTLHEREMGLVLDIVPNHMSTDSANPYWDDVLKHGQASRYAHWFDIDWSPPQRALAGRVLLPVLGRGLDVALGRGEITLAAADDTVRVRYFDHSFPIDPATIPEALARAARAGSDAVARFTEGRDGRRRLRALLGAQHYVLAHWRRAAREINYRRFFNVDDLVALRMEHRSVFDATHARILAWVADGTLDGLRVDHIDGLLEPRAYLERLRAAVSAARPDDGASDGASVFPIVVEKILSPGERLRDDWPVQGTTGYEFLNDLESVFVDARGMETIERRYRAMLRIGRGIRFEDVAYRGKLLILRASLASDVDRVTRLLRPIARRDPRTRELPASVLGEAVVELIACLPVYRTYVDGRTDFIHPEDRRIIEQAITRARDRAVAPRAVLDLLRDVLLLEERSVGAGHVGAAVPAAQAGETPASTELPAQCGRDARTHNSFSSGDARTPNTGHTPDSLAFIQRFQQLGGPAAAKGVEDTALYRYIPLASLNEVGGEPDRPLGDAVALLHAANETRRAHWPRSLLSTSTHDTKRSADTRARLDALSEIPVRWMELTARWHALHRPHRTRVGGRWAPDANAEYLLYQTLVGLWPASDGGTGAALPEAGALDALRGRVDAYMRKAARESKAQTEWTEPNTPYETALSTFIQRILDPESESPFLMELGELAAVAARAGMWSSLSRVLVHLTAPGTPDIYQGDELWSLAVVDPDNRRPVDFAERARLLAGLEERFHGSDDARVALLRELAASPSDGRLKLHIVRRALEARRAHPEIVLRGDYVPLRAEGSAADHVLAFARRADGHALLTIVSRRPLALDGDAAMPVGEAVWGDTVLPLPASLAGRRWECALSGHVIDDAVTRGHRPLRLGQVFHSLHVAMLTSRESSVASRE